MRKYFVRITRFRNDTPGKRDVVVDSFDFTVEAADMDSAITSAERRQPMDGDCQMAIISEASRRSKKKNGYPIEPVNGWPL